MEPFLRLLELVCRELDATDARIEIGGRDPDDPRLIWRRMPEGERIVAIFDAPPDEPERLGQKLETLLEAFRETARHALPHDGSRPLAHAIDSALGTVAERSSAARAVIFDDSSPVLWGSSDPTRTDDEDVETLLADGQVAEDAAQAGLEIAPLVGRPLGEATKALAAAGAQTDRWLRTLRQLKERNPERDAEQWRRHLYTARAVAQVRRGGCVEIARRSDFGYVCRAFAGVYRLVLAFGGTFSELHASAAAIRALPELERLVRSLPPIDPDRGGSGGGGHEAKVVRLPR